MARKVAKEPEEREDGRTVIGISKSKLKLLLARCTNKQGDMDEARSELGNLILAAVENDNLHKGSFAWIRRLNKMDPVKRNEWLFHFDLKRDHMGWDTSDLLQDRPAPTKSRKSSDEDFVLNEQIPAE